MAVPVIAWVGTGKVSSADTNDTLGPASMAVNADSFIEGSSSLSEKVSATTSYSAAAASAITGEPFNFSSTAEHIYIWIQAAGSPDTLANGGFGIVVIDDLASDSEAAWYVGPRPGYTGGWVAYVIHPSRNFGTVMNAGTASWTTTGNPSQLSGVDAIGARWKILNSIKGASDNAYFDAITIGSGYRLTLGDAGSAEGTFANFVTYEENSSNRFGGLISRSGILFVQCKLYIGAASGATNTEFIDDGFTVVWVDARTATQSAVADTFYELLLQKGTGSTTVALSNGTLRAAGTAEVYLNLVGSTSATLTNIVVDRARLIDLDGAVSWIGGQISNSGKTDLGGQPTLEEINYVSPTDGFAFEINATNELTNVSNISFNGAGTGGSGNSAVYINITGAGPFTLDFDGFTYANRVAGSHDIVIAANSNADYTINITNGSDPTVNNLGSGSVTKVLNPVALTITVRDIDTGALITSQDVNILVEASTGGPMTAGDDIIKGFTNASGVISDTRSYASDQPITGWARKGTGSPYYAQSKISGTINKDNGLSLTILMVRDD